MPHPTVSPARDNAPVFELCSEREERFLRDLIVQEAPEALAEHPIPELHALLQAIERMWGGADAKQLSAPPELVYYLAVGAAYMHRVPDDVDEWRAGAADDVYHILQGFMESVTVAIKDDVLVRQGDGEVSIDLFRVPQWLYEEVSVEREAEDMHRATRALGSGGKKA